jgi:uncharacterized protein (DUF1778 family)
MAHSKESFVSINILAEPEQRDLIDEAAARLGRSRSDFMLDAACRKAEDVLLEHDLHTLLDVHLTTTDKLRLLKTITLWDK